MPELAAPVPTAAILLPLQSLSDFAKSDLGLVSCIPTIFRQCMFDFGTNTTEVSPKSNTLAAVIPTKHVPSAPVLPEVSPEKHKEPMSSTGDTFSPEVQTPTVT
eukprot:15366895-Ditylum_brightwellii.AAC.1